METSGSHWVDRMPAHKTCFGQPGRCVCLCDSVSGSQEMGQEHRNWEIWPKGGRMNGKTQRSLISISRWDFPTAHVVVLYQGTGAWDTRGKRVGGSWNAGQSKAFNTRLQMLTWCNSGSKGCKEDCGLDTISVLGRGLWLEQLSEVRWWPLEAIYFARKQAAPYEPKFIAPVSTKSGGIHTGPSIGGVWWWAFYFLGYIFLYALS